MAKIIGTENDDVLVGGSGNDVIRGLGGNDDLNGRSGNDRMTGNGGDDILKGGNGNDRLNGGDGADRLDGGKGNDRLIGGDGNDTLDGGNGDDLIEPGSNVGFGDIVLGSRGNDTIDISGGGNAYWFDYGGLSENLTIKVFKETGSVDKGVLGTDSILGIDSFSGIGGITLIGGSGNDIIKANVAEDLFVRMIGGDGSDRFIGGDGFDQMLQRANGDTGVKVQVKSYKGGMNGTAIDAFGNEDVFRRIDEVRGSTADDILRGGSGRDRFAPVEGNDFVNGRGGDSDLVSYGQVTVRSVNIDLGARTGEIVMNAGTFTDTLRNIEQVIGSRDGNDTILGSDADERFEGLGGNDSLSGLGGNDRLVGGEGNDTLSGGEGNDRLDGESGNDKLAGGDGNDKLAGGKGRDTLEGGDGADTFEFMKGDGKRNKIVDMELGEDIVRIADGATDFGDLTITDAANGARVAFGNAAVVLIGIEAGDLGASDFLFA
jgi:Ca2+-binding RTX toxin-like protein